MTRLEEGREAPFFTLTDHEGRDVSLDDYAGHRLVIFFYPAAFTPGCTTEVCDFRDRYESLYGAGYEIVGVSPDPPERLAEFRNEHGLPYPLLSDEDHAVAEAYGAWGMKENYGKEYLGLIRSTIVVGADGTVEHAWYNVKATGHGARVTEALTG